MALQFVRRATCALYWGFSFLRKTGFVP